MKMLKKIIAILLAAVLAVSCLLMLVSCNKEDDGRRLVEKDTVYQIDFSKSKIKNLPSFILSVALNPQASNITLKADGTGSLSIVLKKNMGSALNELLLGTSDAVIDMSTVLGMLYEYLPGLDLSDLSKTLDIFEGCLGVTLVGVEADDAAMQAFFTEMGATGCLPTPIPLPEIFGLRYESTYFIKDTTSEATGVTYTGAYFGNADPDGETFVFMELAYDEELGKNKVILNYPLIDIYIVAYEVV